jgi:hypothetical protein
VGSSMIASARSKRSLAPAKSPVSYILIPSSARRSASCFWVVASVCGSLGAWPYAGLSNELDATAAHPTRSNERILGWLRVVGVAPRLVTFRELSPRTIALSRGITTLCGLPGARHASGSIREGG